MATDNPADFQDAEEVTVTASPISPDTNATNSQIGRIDGFKAYFASGGDFSKSDLFDVTVHLPADIASQIGITGQDLSFQCENVDLPGKNIDMLPIRHNMFIDRVPVDMTFPEITLSFICRADLLEKKVFDAWLESMISSNEDSKYYGVVKYKVPDQLTDSADNYYSTVTITQYYPFGQLGNPPIATQIDLIDAMPISIASMPLNWQNESINTLHVTFAYRRWVDKTVTVNGVSNAQDAIRNSDSNIPAATALSTVRQVLNVAKAASVLKRIF